jgi:hypothetical protein
LGLNWFRRHFTEQGEDEQKVRREAQREEEKQVEERALLSKIPLYTDRGFDGWQETHKGYRKQKFMSLMRRNAVIMVTVILGIICVTSLFIAYLNAAFYYDPNISGIYRVPDQFFMALAATSGLLLVGFLCTSVLVVLNYRKAYDKLYDNSETEKIVAENFLGEWWPIDLYNGGIWEQEPIGTAKLEQQKVEVEVKLADLNENLKKLTVGADGKPLPQPMNPAEVIKLQNEIAKYENVKKRTEVWLTNNMTVWSNESRDHAFIWSYYKVQTQGNGAPKEEIRAVLEKEIGWKIYAAVPGPTIYQCGHRGEFPTDIGWKTKKLNNMIFSANVDLPTFPIVAEDPVTGTNVIVDCPVMGVRETPGAGKFYDWNEADSIVVSKLLNIPMYTSERSENELKDTKIAHLEQKILRMQHEREMDGVLAEGDRPVTPISMVQPMKEGLQPQPQPQAPPSNAHSWGKTALIASACVALIGIGGVAIVTALAAIL